MKLDILDAHDRYKLVTSRDSSHAKSIGECVQDLVDKRPFGNHPFYIYSHARTDEDGTTKRLIHQPRLTKPKAQTNSMLFRAYPGTDNIKILWMIPAREMWGQYKKGYVTQSETVAWSIQMFQFNRKLLEAKEPDDLTDEQIDQIYKEICLHAKAKKDTEIRTQANNVSDATLFLRPKDS